MYWYHGCMGLFIFAHFDFNELYTEKIIKFLIFFLHRTFDPSKNQSLQSDCFFLFCFHPRMNLNKLKFSMVKSLAKKIK